MNKSLCKRIMATTLATAFMALEFSTFGAMPVKVEATTKVWDRLEDDAELRFAVFSDTHNGPTKPKENETLAKAFDTLYQLDPDIDAVAIVGDITDNGTQAQYNSFQSILDSNLKEETELVISMGNHEGNTAPLFTAATGKEPRANVEINGYHFITLSARSSENVYGGSRYNLDEQWLREQLDAATEEDPTKPVFLFMHHGIEDTAYGTEDWNTKDLGNVIKDYPQVVHFSGHSHYPLNDPRSIYQKDFTALNTATLSYFELEAGMMYGTIPPNSKNAAQMMVFDVNGTNVRIRKLDLMSGEYIGEDWVFDTASGKEGFIYTDARKESGHTPYFEEDAAVKVDSVNDNGCTITIDQAKIEEILGDNHDEVVHSYKFEFINKKTGKIDRTHKIWSEFYFLPMSNTLTQDFSGLKAGTEYEVKVTALSSFKKESTNTIAASFTTTGGFVPPTEEELNKVIDPAEMILVDFEDGTASDKSVTQNTVKTNGTPNIVYDGKLGKNVAEFNGSSAYLYPFSDESYSKIKTNLTMESVFKIDPFSSSYVDVFANMESAGLGFEVARISGDSENAMLEFWIRIRSAGGTGTGSYVKVSAPIPYSEYVHAMATYDGNTVKLYINGELSGSNDAKGEVYHPTGSAKAYAVGADIGSSGSMQSGMKGNISLARLYSRTLSDLDAYLLNKRELEDKQNRTSVILEDISNVDGKEGNEIKMPVVVTSLPGNNEVRSAEMVVDIPTDLDVASVELNKAAMDGENFEYYVEDGKLRIVLTNSTDKPLTLDSTDGNKIIATVTFKLKEGKNNGDTTTVKASRLTLRCNEKVDINYDVTDAVSTISFVVNDNIQAYARELYTSSGVDVIPEGYKAYAIEFIGEEAEFSVKGNNELEVYYNSDLTTKNNKVTYVALVEDTITVEELGKMSNYIITYGAPEKSDTVVFGDINNDGIDAQDALSVVSAWLRKTKPTTKDMLSINVSADGEINTRDSIEIVDRFVSGKEFSILAK